MMNLIKNCLFADKWYHTVCQYIDGETENGNYRPDFLCSMINR